MFRRTILALAILVSSVPAIAQPAPVPALPDSQRVTSYSITATKCVCAVGFQIYGDGSDVDAWLQVFVNGTPYLSTDPNFGWSLSSATGPLTSIPRPINDAVLTFNSVQTGTVQINGARRPRRTSQFPENRGVTARDFNQVLTDIIAQNRENFDRVRNTSGNSNLYATIVGPFTNGHCVSLNSGNLVDAGAVCPTGAGNGNVTTGTAGQFAYYPSNGNTIAGTAAISTRGIYDLRNSGNYNAANVSAAIADAQAAGYSQAFLPHGSTLVNSNTTQATTVPANMTYFCEDSTVTIKAPNPNTNSPNPSGFVFLGAHTVLYGCTFLAFNAPYFTVPNTPSGGATSPGTLTHAYPTFQAIVANQNDVTQSFVSWGGASLFTCGPSWTSTDGTIVYDVPCLQIVEQSGGDGLFVSTENPGGIGPAGGVAIRVVVEAPSGSDSGISIFDGLANPALTHTGMNILVGTSSGSGNALSILDQINGADPAITINDQGKTGTANQVNYTMTGHTSGSFLNMFHTGSTYTGTPINLNLASGGGSFSGAFENFSNNGVQQYTVSSSGQVSAKSGYTANGVAGVACSGTPTASFASVGGIVTHC